MRLDLSQSGPNEIFEPDGVPRPLYEPVLDEMERMGPTEWRRRTRRAHETLLKMQRDLGLTGEDKTHPTDYVPRLIPANEWEHLERGVVQRMLALNEFLRRLEAAKQEIVPAEVIESSILYDTSLPTRFGDVPNRQMGLDLVAVESRGKDWEYLVIEDNAKMPVGMEPMFMMRSVTSGVLPDAYAALKVRPLDNLMQRFGEVLRAASPAPDPTLAILSTGPDDQYYLDHNLFARELDAILAERHEIELDRDGYLVHGETGRRIDIIYERIEDGRIYDDIPGLVEAQAAGRVQAVFAPNLGIADDKGVYPFIPEMIQAYLGEEPILDNVRTYSLAVEKDRRYVMDNFANLVIKSRGGWDGKDVLIAPEESRSHLINTGLGIGGVFSQGAGHSRNAQTRRLGNQASRPMNHLPIYEMASRETIEKFRQQIEENPVAYVAQEIVEFSTHVLCETSEAGGVFQLRDSYADYRIHALAPDADTVEVVPGAMTRVAAPGSKLVNISSGGKMKDTWVLRA